MKKYVYSEAKQVVICGDIHGAFETARETGIYRWIHQFAIEYTKMYFCEKSLL